MTGSPPIFGDGDPESAILARWYFGLDVRSIQEGHHPDFHRGQQAEFAVEVSLPAWVVASGPGTRAVAVRVEDCHYDLVGQVVAAAGEEGWVLDCGLLVQGSGPSPEVGTGAWLSGRARLGVSSAGREELAKPWYIERVFHRVDAVEELIDPRLAMVDSGQLGWEELAFTDAWHDDEGKAEYLLECVLADVL